MPDYEFSLIVATSPSTHEEILSVADALASAGCTDASVRGHGEGMELLFGRAVGSLEDAIATAVSDVEAAGYRVSRIELERDAVLQPA